MNGSGPDPSRSCKLLPVLVAVIAWAAGAMTLQAGLVQSGVDAGKGRIVGVATAQCATGLDSQLAQIKSEIACQLATREGMDARRFDAAADRFITSVRGALSRALTQQQFEQLLDSLSRRHLWLDAPYPDITDLEVEYYTLLWTDYIRLFAARSPMAAAERAVLERQLAQLAEATRAAIRDALNGPREDAVVPRVVQYLSDLLQRDFADPVVPMAKRRFTQEELSMLETWAVQETAKAIREWRASPNHIPNRADIALTPIMSHFWAKASAMQYTAPSLSAELMQQMRAERHALILERAKCFDELSDDEKEREFQRMREREQRHGG